MVERSPTIGQKWSFPPHKVIGPTRVWCRDLSLPCTRTTSLEMSPCTFSKGMFGKHVFHEKLSDNFSTLNEKYIFNYIWQPTVSHEKSFACSLILGSPPPRHREMDFCIQLSLGRGNSLWEGKNGWTACPLVQLVFPLRDGFLRSTLLRERESLSEGKNGWAVEVAKSAIRVTGIHGTLWVFPHVDYGSFHFFLYIFYRFL